MRESIAAGVAGGAADGGIFHGGSYLAGPGPHTVSDLTDRTARGAFVGGVTGGAGGAAAHGISTYAGRTLTNARARPSVESGESVKVADLLPIVQHSRTTPSTSEASC